MTTHRIVKATTEDVRDAATFWNIGKFKALGGGSPSETLLVAKSAGAPDRVIENLEKATVGPATTDGSTWAGNMVGEPGLSRAAIDQVANVGRIDQIMPFTVQVPPNTAANYVAVAASGALVDESDWKVVEEMTISTSGQLMLQKVVAAVVFSKEVARSPAPEANALFKRSLLKTTARVTDSAAISVLTDGITPISSLGADAVREDIAGMLSVLTIGEGSKVFLLAQSGIVKHLALSLDPAGRPAFPGVRIDGGDISGITVLPSDAVPEGSMVMIDASGVVTSKGFLNASAGNHATMRLSNTPDSDTGLTSLWQKNLICLKIERWFGVARLRDDAVALIEDAAYGEAVTT